MLEWNGVYSITRASCFYFNTYGITRLFVLFWQDWKIIILWAKTSQNTRVWRGKLLQREEVRKLRSRSAICSNRRTSRQDLSKNLKNSERAGRRRGKSSDEKKLNTKKLNNTIYLSKISLTGFANGCIASFRRSRCFLTWRWMSHRMTRSLGTRRGWSLGDRRDWFPRISIQHSASSASKSEDAEYKDGVRSKWRLDIGKWKNSDKIRLK